MARPVAQDVSVTSEHAALDAARVAFRRHAGVSEVARAALDALAQRETHRAARRPVEPDAERT